MPDIWDDFDKEIREDFDRSGVKADKTRQSKTKQKK
jgi:hypothetical protein